MFPQTLPQLIQDHREQVIKGALERIGRESQLAQLLDERRDMADWFNRIVASVDRWPAIATDDQAEHLHLSFGEGCARSGIPLHQVVRALHLLKTRIVDFAHSQGMARNSLEIYVEEELENRLSFFFDWLLYQVVLGYESVHPLHLSAPQKVKTEDVRALPGWVPL
jgi:hypothetical protein